MEQAKIIINTTMAKEEYKKFLYIATFRRNKLVIPLMVRENAQRVKTDKTGTFDSVNTLEFYDDKLVMENQQLKSTGELKYDQFFAVMESKEYFIFYLTVNQASLIRKKDVDDLGELKQFIKEKFESKYKQI